MYCTNCGFMLEDGTKFCTNCGTKVESPVESENNVSSDETTVLPDAAAPADETVILGGAAVMPEPAPPQEEPVDMTHAFDPQTPPAPSATAQMPVIPAAAPAPRNYNAVPEEIVGKTAQPKKKLGTGAIIGIIVGAVAVAAIIAICLFMFVFSGGKESTVSFETAGGSTIQAVQVAEGESINSPANPIKDGYSFDGWYADPSFTTPVTFPLTPDEDMTLYAKWVAVEGATGTDAGETSETYTTSDQARGALKGYLSSLEDADEVVHDFAIDDFNKKFNKGTSKVAECMEDCNDARQKVYDLLASASGTQWRVSTLAIPETFSEDRAMLEEASDTLITRLNAYENALRTISSMGPNATDKEIETAIKDYLNDGHVAYEDYKALVKKLKKDL